MKTNLFGANALRPCIALLIGLLTVAPACTRKSANAQETASAAPKVSQSVDRPEDPVRAEIVDGRVRLIAKTDELGWPERTQFVEGLTGRCVGLFVGDIGQDTNPFLCMLMDDGGVELLSYKSLGHEAYGGTLCFTSSGRLPGLKDITRFREGPVMNEYGFADYGTIFAIDREGHEHEIEPCIRPFSALYSYSSGGTGVVLEQQLVIYPDWTFLFTLGIAESELVYTYTGRLRPIKMDYENEVYEYSYTMLTRFDYPPVGDEEAYENARPQPATEHGSFRLTYEDESRSYELVVLSGPLPFATEKGSPARYRRVRNSDIPAPNLVTD